MKIAEVLLDQRLLKPLDYLVPPELEGEVAPGMRVVVPLRNQEAKGTIGEIKSHTLFSEVKSILRLEQHQLEDKRLLLAKWMATYYATPLQRVIAFFTPPHIRKNTKEKVHLFWRLKASKKEALDAIPILRVRSPLQANYLAQLLEREVPCEEVSRLGAKTFLEALAKKGLIEKIEKSPFELSEAEFFLSPPKALIPEQQEALSRIESGLQKNRFETHLLFGVTGSGKTEVYLQAIESALQKGKSALVLVPEIALTAQTIERFYARFGMKVGVLHHRRTMKERATVWKGLEEGTLRLLIGARSAIFAPIKDLGLIIIDEEHDSSYKQTEEGPCYNARDVAVMRGKFEEAIVVLGSATPSLESYQNGLQGKYILSRLTTRPAAALPHVTLVDMKEAIEKEGRFTHFSSLLLEAIQERTAKGEQTLLLLNRRGYRRMQVCLGCQSAIKCPRCDLSLTYHKGDELLSCHLCHYEMAPPRFCPACKSPQGMEFKGFGTEHVEKSLQAIFPSIRTLRMDRDTTKKKEGHEAIFQEFKSHKADVLIGTQMIAKGLHFPQVTLVGVLLPDSGLLIPDFRAAEKTFQLLTQVSGRSGRGEIPGDVIIQTFLPNHPLFLLAKNQDFIAFATQELQERKAFCYPPFCRLVKCTASSKNGPLAEKALQEIQAFLKTCCPAAEWLPILPSGHPKINDHYRFQFLVKIDKVQPLLAPLAACHGKVPRGVKLVIDVDPQSTFF